MERERARERGREIADAHQGSKVPKVLAQKAVTWRYKVHVMVHGE